MCIKDFVKENYDLIIVELLPFCIQKAPAGLLSISDFQLVIVRADRLWNEADQKLMQAVDENSKIPAVVFLNCVQWYILEHFIGEIPQKRNFFKKAIKNWMMLDFSSKSLSKKSIKI